MQNVHSQAFLRQRKFLLVLPLLTLPFITLGFWALGGGTGGARPVDKGPLGLNLELPAARLKDEGAMNKLSFYDQAQEDSIRLWKEKLNDPYYRSQLDTVAFHAAASPLSRPPLPVGGLRISPYASSGISAEQRISERLDALHKALETPATDSEKAAGVPTVTSDLSGDIDRLEALMEGLQTGSAADPEITELNNMLDKILDIQHPDRVEKRRQGEAAPDRTTVRPERGVQGAVEATLLGDTGRQTARDTQNRFYSDATADAFDETSNTIAALLPQQQTATTGSTVKLQLATAIRIDDTFIPRGTYVYGTATLRDERLHVSVTGIRYKDRLFPVKLAAYDLDGLEGLYVPGSLSREAVKNATDRNLASLQLLTYDPSLKAQAAAAGIGAAKGLLSQKTKMVKVTLKAGYSLLLKNENPTH